MSHPEATHSHQRATSEPLTSNRDESDEMDRAETVVYQALADNLMGRLNRGPQWNTIEQIMASLHDEARNILAALKAARIAVVELPEQCAIPGNWGEECLGAWEAINFGADPVSAWPDERRGVALPDATFISAAAARDLAAALLAAADHTDAAAVGARITVEEQ
ncbi:hypothetical protein M2272_005885 [Mycobacterium frederiksbergense]|uniref:Uncharacterized protein n=1 Tax=Mycolicibacterium frederiksbergense TaxID=117567 RepID=A0ABT6LAF8_9MYCO|nr:hypothetical protein [Mycolicibacterium frederiksbergense]MDH6199217.1 hypothetical protein [Mycolicibacterium frederiksbergense]